MSEKKSTQTQTVSTSVHFRIYSGRKVNQVRRSSLDFDALIAITYRLSIIAFAEFWL